MELGNALSWFQLDESLFICVDITRACTYNSFMHVWLNIILKGIRTRG